MVTTPEIITFDGEHKEAWVRAYRYGAGCAGFTHMNSKGLRDKSIGCAYSPTDKGVAHAASGWEYPESGYTGW